MVAQAHPHPAARRAFSVTAGVLAVIVAAAMMMVFVVLVASVVQNVLGIAVTPTIGTARSTFWWVVSNRDLPP